MGLPLPPLDPASAKFLSNEFKVTQAIKDFVI